ncbi:protein of unknown function [Taphrina deformans PYCC 5710]|uniref:Uncharacterized protein n=1 Tax=Taphrina deformans (strain PYCC 5710 / ATCC 11124 / CBS 356.35 / IMI 108563 / JCM 9778 / NBRC 8474) TaxID=1097556 RepID=R4XPE2_TAPDE|nr:protein of unknown function [Taphrina deformans PYCC 5710]|eukprot:CCG85100.1 protein of unknown function [Taphrina deformans PYCC 5710]
MDRLKPHQVEMIRKRYASIHKTSVDGYQGLRSIKPAIDIEVNFEDDRVTLGLFCNRPVLGQDQVQAFMRDFWHEFENL